MIQALKDNEKQMQTVLILKDKLYMELQESRNTLDDIYHALMEAKKQAKEMFYNYE